MTQSSNSRLFRARRWSGIAWTACLVAGVLALGWWFRPCLWGNGECEGGSPAGLVLGFLAFLAILVSLLYSRRKGAPRHMRVPLEQWLYAHVIIGALSLAIVIAHSGYRLQDHVAALALLFLALTVVSGAAGLFLIYYLPRAQAGDEASVLLPDDLCRRLTRLHEEISELCSEKGGRFLQIYTELVIPLYQAPVGTTPPSADISPWAEKADPEEQEALMNLAAKTEAVHDLLILLARHLRFRWMIRGWLLLHVPATIGLIIFTVVHVISVTWYGAL